MYAGRSPAGTISHQTVAPINQSSPSGGDFFIFRGYLRFKMSEYLAVAYQIIVAQEQEFEINELIFRDCVGNKSYISLIVLLNLIVKILTR